MTVIDSRTSSDLPRKRSRSIMVSLLFLGMGLALAGNVYQFAQGKRLARDFASMQEKVGNQFAEMRELEAGALEQNLRRLDEMNKQFEQITAATLEQARSEVRRNRSELTKALELKQKELARQMSDLKSDLKEEASAKIGQVSNDLAKTRMDLERAVDDISVKSGEGPAVSEAPPTTNQTAVRVEQPAQSPQKKSFWGRLNPFKRDKPKTSVAAK